jgi:quercetin dioxygenase-like cupin family protein
VTISVLEVGRAASGRRFLDAATVEGTAYELPPGERWEAAPSDRHQVIYVTAGWLSALFQGDEHELVPGRGVYCEPGEGCSLQNVGDGSAALYCFAVLPS